MTYFEYREAILDAIDAHDKARLRSLYGYNTAWFAEVLDEIGINKNGMLEAIGA